MPFAFAEEPLDLYLDLYTKWVDQLTWKWRQLSEDETVNLASQIGVIVVSSMGLAGIDDTAGTEATVSGN